LPGRQCFFEMSHNMEQDVCALTNGGGQPEAFHQPPDIGTIVYFQPEFLNVRNKLTQGGVMLWAVGEDEELMVRME
jgi:hypothetical protein